MSAQFVILYRGARRSDGPFVSEADAWWAAYEQDLNPAEVEVVAENALTPIRANSRNSRQPLEAA